MRFVESLNALQAILEGEAFTGLIRLVPEDAAKAAQLIVEARRVQEAFPELPVLCVREGLDGDEQEERAARFLEEQGYDEKLLLLPHWWIAWNGRVRAVFKQSKAIVRDVLSMFGGKSQVEGVIEWTIATLHVERGTGRPAKKEPPKKKAPPPGAPPPRPAAPRAKQPHEILGVSPSASPDEVRKAWKKLVSEHHPDKFAHLGKEKQDAANAKLVEINAAYQAMKK